jgi:hypothetical protein
LASSLDEYLVQFRGGGAAVRVPAALRPAARLKAAKGKARAFVLLQELLPPAMFDLAVGRCYQGLRARAAGNPGRERTLPDFLLIGAAKCGTTSLYDWICEHPLIGRPTTNGRPRKELLFFDYEYRRGVEWYRTHFPTERERADFARAHGRPPLIGEATASYLTSYWVPERVAAVVPNVRLIVTLRDPINRAFSAFQMSRREGFEECEQFETALALEHDRLTPELARTQRNPHYNPAPPVPLGYWSYLQRSRYAEHVERWLAHFPREQLLFVKFEELAAEPQRVLDEVYQFLGLAPHRLAAFRKLNVGRYQDEIRPETRAQLHEYFRPHNERLRQLTGIDLGWDEER